MKITCLLGWWQYEVKNDNRHHHQIHINHWWKSSYILNILKILILVRISHSRWRRCRSRGLYRQRWWCWGLLALKCTQDTFQLVEGGQRGITVDDLTPLPPTPQKKDITWSTGRRWWQALKEERATRSRLLKEVCTTAQLLVLRRELKNLKIPKSNLHAAALEICWRIWGEGGGGREGGGEEAFLSLQWSLPPQWSWRAYTVELTQPRSHWRQPGTYCTALYHQPPFLINVQIVSSNQYYVEKSHTVCTLFPWDIASNTAIKNLFPELGGGVKSPKLFRSIYFDVFISKNINTDWLGKSSIYS